MSDYINTPEPSGEPEREATPAPHGYQSTETGWVFRDAETYSIGQDAIAELNRQWVQLVLRDETIASLRTENLNLRTEQIEGSDPRLTDFWAKAQELADRANHCEVFDNIAEALGGPRRQREYSVRVTFMVSVPVTLNMAVEARDEEEAREYAEDNIGCYELEHYADWYGAEVEDHTIESEAEEA